MSDILQAKTITGEYSGFADSALRAVSSTFLTAHQDLSDYQTTAGMTIYANSASVTGTAQYGLTTAGWSEITGGGGGATYTSPSGTILIDGNTLEATTSAIGYQEGFISALTFEEEASIPENNDVNYYEFIVPAREISILEYRYWSDDLQDYITERQEVNNYNEEDITVRYPYWSADYNGNTSMSGNFISISTTPEGTTALSAFGKTPSVVELALKSDVSRVTTASTGDDYKIEIEGLDIYGTVYTQTAQLYAFSSLDQDYKDFIDTTFDQDIFISNYNFVPSTMGVFTITDTDTDYWDQDSYNFNVILKLNGENFETSEPIDYSAIIGNVTMNRVNGPMPPLSISGDLNLPSSITAVSDPGNIGIEPYIVFSANENFSLGVTNWTFAVGVSVPSGTTSASGIFIPSKSDFDNLYNAFTAYTASHP